MEIVAVVGGTLLIGVALIVFTSLAWWLAFLIGLIVMVFGVWIGPELF